MPYYTKFNDLLKLSNLITAYKHSLAGARDIHLERGDVVEGDDTYYRIEDEFTRAQQIYDNSQVLIEQIRKYLIFCTANNHYNEDISWVDANGKMFVPPTEQEGICFYFLANIMNGLCLRSSDPTQTENNLFVRDQESGRIKLKNKPQIYDPNSDELNVDNILAALKQESKPGGSIQDVSEADEEEIRAWCMSGNMIVLVEVADDRSYMHVKIVHSTDAVDGNPDRMVLDDRSHVDSGQTLLVVSDYPEAKSNWYDHCRPKTRQTMSMFAIKI